MIFGIGCAATWPNVLSTGQAKPDQGTPTDRPGKPRGGVPGAVVRFELLLEQREQLRRRDVLVADAQCVEEQDGQAAGRLAAVRRDLLRRAARLAPSLRLALVGRLERVDERALAADCLADHKQPPRARGARVALLLRRRLEPLTASPYPGSPSKWIQLKAATSTTRQDRLSSGYLPACKNS